MRATSVLAISAACWLVAAPAPAQTTSPNSRPLALSAESVLLLDTQGRVLYAKKPAEDHAPASLVKLMTLYLACEALDAGRAQWEDPVLVSHRASVTPRYRMGLKSGESAPLRTLLEGVAIASANDAATAEAVASKAALAQLKAALAPPAAPAPAPPAPTPPPPPKK